MRGEWHFHVWGALGLFVLDEQVRWEPLMASHTQLLSHGLGVLWAPHSPRGRETGRSPRPRSRPAIFAEMNTQDCVVVLSAAFCRWGHVRIGFVVMSFSSAVFPIAQSGHRSDGGAKATAMPPLSEAQWSSLASALSTPGLQSLCVATETTPLTHSPELLLQAAKRPHRVTSTWEAHPHQTAAVAAVGNRQVRRRSLSGR